MPRTAAGNGDCFQLAIEAVLGFVPGQDIDPISYSRPYYVGPDGPPAEWPYALLVEALACKVAVRSRERPHPPPRWPNGWATGI
ncbi:Ku protein [Streptomyces sp. NPDC056105]|uniref:Ku protein n=1 Tax=Streptomyces sp. NPDC056105 TaxID=3345714 RepID=UPI0035D739FA